MTTSVESSIIWNGSTPVQDFTKTTAYPLEINFKGQPIPVYAYMTPYTADELKSVLKSATSGYRREKRDVEIVREDRQIYTVLCEAHFVKLGNASGTPDEQRAFLDRYPEIKPSIVEFGFGGLQLERTDRTEDADVLDISVELSESVRCFQDIYDPATDKVVRVTFVHNHKHPTEGQYRTYRGARRNKFISTKTLWMVTEQHNTLEKLYDDVIESIDGACADGVPCDSSPKTEWLRDVPLWHKLFVVDQIFGDLIEKNA